MDLQPEAAHPLVRGRRPLAASGLTLLLLLGPGPTAPAFAQSSSGGDFSVELAGTSGTLAGSDFDNVGIGAGGEVLGHYALGSGLSLGLGVQGSWHNAEGLPGSLQLLGAFVEPRYRFGGTDGQASPFAGLRLGAARWSATERGNDVEADAEATGFQVGGTAGIAYPLSDRLSFVAAGLIDFLSFGEVDLTATVGGESVPEPELPDSETGGARLGLRASLQLRIP